MHGRPVRAWLWYQFAKYVVRALVSVVYRARYTGCENVPRSGGVLLVANHQSHLDPPLIGAGLPRPSVYLARASLFRFPPFAALIRSLGAIPIDRERSALAGIRLTLQWLQRGEMVLVFPEGSRTFDGQIGEFKPGLTLIARKAQVPILPAAIDGAFQAWPRTRSFPSVGTIDVHYGPPFWPDQIQQLSDAELSAAVERHVRECLDLVRQRREHRIGKSPLSVHANQSFRRNQDSPSGRKPMRTT